MSEKRTIISSNRLVEGDIVYFTGLSWTSSFAEAALYDKASLPDAERQAGLSVSSNLVVGLELVEVIYDNGVVTPVRTREVVRAIGPTVATESGAKKLYDPTAQNWRVN
jgi:hypothetical protein